MLLSPLCPQSHHFHSRFRGVEQFYDDIKKYFLPVRGFSVITNPGHLITRTLPASAEIFSTQNLFKRVDKCGVRKPRLFSTACPPTLTPEQVSGSSTVGQGSKWQSSSLWPPITITSVLPFSALALLQILIFLFSISFFCTHLKYLIESPWHCVASWWDTQPRKYFDVVSEFWLTTSAPSQPSMNYAWRSWFSTKRLNCEPGYTLEGRNTYTFRARSAGSWLITFLSGPAPCPSLRLLHLLFRPWQPDFLSTGVPGLSLSLCVTLAEPNL